MFKSRFLNVFIYTLLGLTLLIIIGFFTYQKFFNVTEAAGPPSIDEIADHLTVDTEEMTTNLKDSHYIRVKFKIQVDNKDAKEELEKRQFQVKNSIITLLSGMTPKELSGPVGLTKLENSIKASINKYMEAGKVSRVYTTEKLIQ